MDFVVVVLSLQGRLGCITQPAFFCLCIYLRVTEKKPNAYIIINGRLVFFSQKGQMYIVLRRNFL